MSASVIGRRTKASQAWSTRPAPQAPNTHAGQKYPAPVNAQIPDEECVDDDVGDDV
jgi:hypothetical protein